MFEDLIPSEQAQTPAPPPGPFDDLIPAGGEAGRAGGIAAEPPAGTEPKASVGSVLKQLAIGVPEGVLSTAGTASDVMSGNFLTHRIVSALAGEKVADAAAPSHNKLLHEALPNVLNPENYPAHNLPERIARGVGEALPGVAIPGGSLASRALTQVLAGGTGALAAEAAPEPYKPAAQLLGNLIGGGITSLRSARTAAKARTSAETPSSSEETASEAPSAHEVPSEQQIAENTTAIADAVRDVGVPPDRIDPADIEELARSVTRRDLLTLEAFKRVVFSGGLKHGSVTPEEVKQIYGKDVADEYRGTSTPENGSAAPPQGANRGEPGGDTPEGQQLPGPGENGGEAPGPGTAGVEAAETRSVEAGEQPRSAPEGAVPNNAARPEETSRPDEIKAERQVVSPSEAREPPEFLQQAEDTAGALKQRAKVISGRLQGARIEAPNDLFGWMRKEPGEFFANFDYLKRKHPEYFSTPAEARNHVLDVLSDAHTAIHQKRGAVALIARDGGDHLIAFDAEKRQGRYVIVTAYRLSRHQFNRMVSGAERDGELTVHRYSTPP